MADPNVLQAMRPGDESNPSWWLRLPGGVVFGPTDLPTLRAWAEQRRVAPGHEVSSDNRRWVRAETIPQLEMVWNVELADGSVYGPLNLKAMSDLLEEGTITLQSRLINVRTKAETRLAQLRATAAPATPAQPLPAAVPRETPAPDRPIPTPAGATVAGGGPVTAAAPAAQPRLDALEQTLQSLRKELETERTANRSGREALANELQRFRETCEARLAETATRHDRAGDALVALRGQADNLAARLTELRRQVQAGGEQQTAEATRNQELFARAQAAWQDAQARLHALETAQRAAPAELAARIAQHIETWQRDLSSAQERHLLEIRRLVEQETAGIAGQVRSLREEQNARVGEGQARLTELTETQRDIRAQIAALHQAQTRATGELTRVVERQQTLERQVQDHAAAARETSAVLGRLDAEDQEQRRGRQALEATLNARAADLKRMVDDMTARLDEQSQRLIALNRQVQDGASADIDVLRARLQAQLDETTGATRTALGTVEQNLGELRQTLDALAARQRTDALAASNQGQQAGLEARTLADKIAAQQADLERLRREFTQLQTACREPRPESAPVRQASVIDVEPLADAATPTPPGPSPRAPTDPPPQREAPRAGQNLRELEEQAARELRIWQEARRKFKK